MRALALLLLTVAGCDLVFGVDPDAVDAVLAELGATGHTAACIGTARAGTGRLALR